MAVLTPSLFVESKNILVLALGLMVLVLLPKVSMAQAGALDTSFDGDGKVTTHTSSQDYALSVVIQPDGRIITAGWARPGSDYDFALVRYNSDGSLDTGFDGDGKVTTDFGGSDNHAYAVAIQSDGKIVAAGRAIIGGRYDFAVARYHADGSLDSSFDGDGKVTTDFAGGHDYAYAVAIQSDDKIVVAGRAGADVAIARYNADGSLDTGLDSDGKVTTDLTGLGYSDWAKALALQGDGKIVVAGNALMPWSQDFALARYNVDGSLDINFDMDGILVTDFAGFVDEADAVAIQADGRIVAAGLAQTDFVYDHYDFAVARYNADGSLDSSFDGDGKVTTDFTGSFDQGFSVAIQSDGKILVAGRNQHGGSRYDFALARYNVDGSLDTSFDGDGKVTTDFGGDFDNAYSVAIQGDGKIVAAGVAHLSWPSYYDFAVVRYLSGLVNQSPIADANGPYVANEGSPVTFDGAGSSDPDGDPLTYAWDFGDGDNDSGQSPAHPYADNGAYTVTLTVTDSEDNSDSDETTAEIANVSPSVGAITGPMEPLAANTPATFRADFTDPGTADTHTALWDWGDSNVTAGTVTEANGSGSVEDTYQYTAAGIYEVTLTVTDDDGASDQSVFQFIVVYDPSAGFVTGGGWIDSPWGAYIPDPRLTGKATFGFVSKYQKNKEVPSGNTQFRFHAGDLAFASDAYDWLIVAHHKAMFKGTGSISGSGNYGFQLSAIDAALTPSTDTDLFRIRIWDKDNADALVYDNQVSESDNNADPTTALAGGSIVIHEGKSKKTDELADLPTEFVLHGNYPNPFNPTTSIRFDLPERSEVRLVVFDLLGRQVTTVVDQTMEAGRHAVTWDASPLPSGVYLYRLEAGTSVAQSEMILLR